MLQCINSQLIYGGVFGSIEVNSMVFIVKF